MTLRTPAFNDAKTYGFEWLRALLELDGQEGVVNAGDFKVTAAAGGGMRVDIAAGLALVKGDSGVPGIGLSQGLFLVVNDAAIANAVTFAAADATNPRVDQVVLRVRDSSDLGSGADDALFEIVQGAATAGATLDNRNGAAALPNDRLRLADVLIPAASAAVTAANVRDRRPWARGFNARTRYTGGNVAIAVVAYAAINAALQMRAELSGAPIRLRLTGGFFSSVANKAITYAIYQDGGQLFGAGAERDFADPMANTSGFSFEFTELIEPTAGSKLFEPRHASLDGATSVTTMALTTRPLVFEVEELVRQNAVNT